MKHFASRFPQDFLNNWSIKRPFTGIFWGEIVLRIICIFPWKKGSLQLREKGSSGATEEDFFFLLAGEGDVKKNRKRSRHVSGCVPATDCIYSRLRLITRETLAHRTTL